MDLMYGQKSVMPIEQTIVSWVAMSWEDEMSRLELLAFKDMTTQEKARGPLVGARKTRSIKS